MTTRTKIALGIFGAALAGVAIGLLVAPEKGAATRKRIGTKTGAWVNSLGHLFTNGKHRLAEATQHLQEVKAKAQKKARKVKDAIG